MVVPLTRRVKLLMAAGPTRFGSMDAATTRMSVAAWALRTSR